jgi:RNA polymerase sigma factor (sigma-70 family)
MSKDYYATLRIQQGRLKAAMQELGIETAAELSRRSGVTQGYIGQMLNFRLSPRADNGEWRAATLAICKALGSEPSELFPEHLDHEVATNRITSFVEHAQLSGGETLQLGPVDECQQAEMEQTLDEVLGALTDRERSVFKARYGEGKTLEEAGRDQSISAERARQIAAKALRKLRLPSRLKKLEGVCAFACDANRVAGAEWGM